MQLTMSLTWPDGSGSYNCPLSLPESVATMLAQGRQPRLVVISKHYELQSGFGSLSMGQSTLCHLSPCHPSLNPAIGGSRAKKRADSERRR
jgi:hypothetical protein